MSRHNAPMTDEYMRAQRRRNELRLNHSRLELGERWLLHPANATGRSFDIAAPFRKLAEALKHVSFTAYRPPRADAGELRL